MKTVAVTAASMTCAPATCVSWKKPQLGAVHVLLWSTMRSRAMTE